MAICPACSGTTRRAPVDAYELRHAPDNDDGLWHCNRCVGGEVVTCLFCDGWGARDNCTRCSGLGFVPRCPTHIQPVAWGANDHPGEYQTHVRCTLRSGHQGAFAFGRPATWETLDGRSRARIGRFDRSALVRRDGRSDVHWYDPVGEQRDRFAERAAQEARRKAETMARLRKAQETRRTRARATWLETCAGFMDSAHAALGRKDATETQRTDARMLIELADGLMFAAAHAWQTIADGVQDERGREYHKQMTQARKLERMLVAKPLIELEGMPTWEGEIGEIWRDPDRANTWLYCVGNVWVRVVRAGAGWIAADEAPPGSLG